MPTKRRKFMSGEAYAARVEYLRQWEGYLADPLNHEEPDHALRLIDTAAGPKTGVAHVRDLRDGALVVGVSFNRRGHYFLDPLDDLALDLGTAFGMSLSCGPDGAYPSVRKTEQTGPMIRLSRLFLDVGPGGAALRRNSFAGCFARHSLRRRDLASIAGAHWQAAGSSTRAPVQRDEFVDATAEHWARNYWPAGIPVPLVDHAANVLRAFRAGDLAYATAGKPEADLGFTSLGSTASAVLHRVGNSIPA